MRTSWATVWLVTAAVVIGACGADDAPSPRTDAVSSFDRLPHGQRVFAAFGQVGSAQEEVTFPADARAAGIQADCVGRGELTVTIAGQGSAVITCSTRRGEGRGTVGLFDETAALRRAGTISIATADQDAVWSVAVTAGPKVFNY